MAASNTTHLLAGEQSLAVCGAGAPAGASLDIGATTCIRCLIRASDALDKSLIPYSDKARARLVDFQVALDMMLALDAIYYG